MVWLHWHRCQRWGGTIYELRAGSDKAHLAFVHRNTVGAKGLYSAVMDLPGLKSQLDGVEADRVTMMRHAEALARSWFKRATTQAPPLPWPAEA